jgi:OOP family OmpA-OmpF porin
MSVPRTLLLAGAAAAFLPVMAAAQDSKNQGYLVDTYGNGIATTYTTALCVRTSDWTPARSVEPCDRVARAAEAPAPRTVVAAAPTPAPQKPAPARAAPRNITFFADMLFAFDKSVLKPEGRAALDTFARDLAGASYNSILTIGHTDRIGSNDYNQRLSMRRAHAVKDYLVSRDIPAHRISAEGRGETQPVTPAGECLGAKNAKTIACLQPDRRVHVEVTGTQGASASAR